MNSLLRSAFRVTLGGAGLLLGLQAAAVLLDAAPEPATVLRSVGGSGSGRPRADGADAPPEPVSDARSTAGNGGRRPGEQADRPPAADPEPTGRPERPSLQVARSETASGPTLFFESPPDEMPRRARSGSPDSGVTGRARPPRRSPQSADLSRNSDPEPRSVSEEVPAGSVSNSEPAAADADRPPDEPGQSVGPVPDPENAALLLPAEEDGPAAPSDGARGPAVHDHSASRSPDRSAPVSRVPLRISSGGGGPETTRGEAPEPASPHLLAQLGKLGDQLQRLLQRPMEAAARQSDDAAGASRESDDTAPGDAAEEDPASGGRRQDVGGGGDSESPVLEAEPSRGTSDRYSLQIEDAEISEVLKMLGQLSGLNIVVGQGVTGTVSASFHDVTVDEALAGVLKSLGFVHKRDGRFVYVMTREEAQTRKQLERKLVTKIYRPHYISVKDLKELVSGLLTPEIGQIATTSPARSGIAPSAEDAGGNTLSQRDALLVQDYPEVIDEIDRVVAEMDVPPMQVVIEAMILNVRLTNEMQFGVNFALLNGRNDSFTISGSGGKLASGSGLPGLSGSILPPGASFLAQSAGLKWGLIRGDISAFLNALETISDTNLIASPQLRVLNKQRADLIIGQRLGYRTRTFQDNQTIENVEFLEVGTKLILRPYVSPDGRIRMEIHPERSDGFIDEAGLPQSSTTEVTTNVMARDGQTIVIGGLISEQVGETRSRVPLLGALPWVGHVFQSRSDELTRHELIVLITPRIVREPAEAAAGHEIAMQAQRRLKHFKDNLAPVNRHNLARIEMDWARYYYDRGEYSRARRHVERALTHEKNNLEALRLRERIDRAWDERAEEWLWLPWEPFLSEDDASPRDG